LFGACQLDKRGADNNKSKSVFYFRGPMDTHM